MVAKRFFYICAGILCLALAYHFGAQTAAAQAPGNPVVASAFSYVYTANGDVYLQSASSPPTWQLLGNVFGGGTPVTQPTWGQLKSRYRAPATPSDK